jgi:DNA-binding NarL/FixJ family response regulator
MIRVLICDDQVIVCQGLQAILDVDPELDVVGMAYDGEQALAAIPSTQPDVILMDLKMPRMGGIMATRLIRERFPAVRIVVLTTYSTDEWLIDAIRAGAAGYILKDTPRERLIAAIKGTMAGETYVDPGVAGTLFNHVARHGVIPQPKADLPALTEREREILGLIVQGMTNAEIAMRLHLSEGTVRNYVSAVLTKLDVTDRTQAVVRAIRLGLVSLDVLL